MVYLLNALPKVVILFSNRAWDVYLIPPIKGKKLRSTTDLMKFILANPTVPVNARSVLERRWRN